MKAALCFIINYDHVLNKEQIWKEWIEPNQDIFNVYFFYKDFAKIQSAWIREHALPQAAIVETSYYHVVPAYLSLYRFAMKHDLRNKWFCMLTDSCCPIISPQRFRKMFFKYSQYSLLSWKPAWWNIYFHRRANLAKLPAHLRLGHDPWFILTREHIQKILSIIQVQKELVYTICAGGLANESLFAILLKLCGELDDNESKVRSVSTHLTDWGRRPNPTSPHLFTEGNEQDIDFLKRELERNPEALFIRKVAPEFPDDVLRYFIYEFGKNIDDDFVGQECLHLMFIAAFALFVLILYSVFK